MPEVDSGTSAAASVPAAVRFLDLSVLAVALPIFVAADLPLWGYAVGASAWVVQRAIQVAVRRRATASRDPRTVVGLAAASMIGRGWLCAGAIFGVGLAEGDAAGLAAALLVIALFTVYFMVQMVLRPFETRPVPR